MGIEDRMNSSIDRKHASREIISPMMKKAHEKAMLVLNNPDNSIHETAFEQVYGTEAIARDVEEADRLAALFQKNEKPGDAVQKMISEIMEAIILENSELSEWLGNAQVLKTARYDDFKHKTDMIAEWYSPQDGSRILALAVDVTFSKDGIGRKMRDIKDEIDKGSLGSLRYFQDTRGDFMGTRNNVPRVVIGMSYTSIEELSGLWLRNDKKALGAHPIQRLLVEEITQQLEAMHAYASKNGKNHAIQPLAQSLAIMRPLRAKKVAYRLGDLATDPVAEAVAWNSKTLFT